MLGALALTAMLVACQSDQGQPGTVEQKAGEESAILDRPQPPMPPLSENFEGDPILSLFPRIGDYRPEKDDRDTLSFHNTYLDHLVHTAGVVKLSGGDRAFLLRSVAQIDSIGYFSPVAVDPDRHYRLSARLKTDLPPGDRAGIGILEFDQFLWVAQQYPQSLIQQHQTGMQEGIELTGSRDWQSRSYEVITGPKTHMIHLIFFLEGPTRPASVLFDDVEIAPIR